MRYAARITTFAVLALAGCRSNSPPLSNPFLTPDRVPPPSTQLLTPGSAQPYYPGDSIPATAPLATPTTPTPAPTFVPAPNAAPPVNAYPGSPVTPTTTPGYGGVYPPQANGDAVGIPGDDQAMRFASASLTPEPSTAAAASTATPLNPAASTFRTPIQSMLPVAQPLASSFPRNAGGQTSVQSAAFGAPAQTPQIREVTPAEYQAPAAAAGAAGVSAASSDGFRPQSNEPRTESTIAAPLTNGFRPPSIGKQTAGGDNPTGKFGVGGKQEWLRGQLEYWPEAGEWSIRYMDDGPADQLGGRVLIDNPQVLGNLPAGEFVMVEGQLYGRQIDESSYRPAYRVSVVQRQRQ